MSCLSEASTLSQHSVQPSAASAAAAAVHSRQHSRGAVATTTGSRFKGPQELAALRQQFAGDLHDFMISTPTGEPGPGGGRLEESFKEVQVPGRCSEATAGQLCKGQTPIQ